MPRRTLTKRSHKKSSKKGPNAKSLVANRMYASSKAKRGWAGTVSSRPLENFSLASPFPAEFYTTNIYSDKIQLTAGTAGVCGTEQVWFLNSLFDPDFTGAGHQPYGFDQLTPMYNKYNVISVDIEMTIYQPSTASLALCYQVSNNSDLGLALLNPKFIVEHNTGDWVYIPNDGTATVIKKSFNIADIAGVSRAKVKNDDVYSSITGSSPSSAAYFRIAAANLLLNTGGTMYVDWKCTYHSRYFDRISAVSS